MFTGVTDSTQNYCITHAYQLGSCDDQQNPIRFTCKVNDPEDYERVTTLNIFTGGEAYIWIFMMLHFGSILICIILCQLFDYEETTCDNAEYGSGQAGDISRAECEEGQEGVKIATCQETGQWKLIENRCIIIRIKEQLTESEVGDSLVVVFFSFFYLEAIWEVVRWHVI